jgi:hypothetical protein
MLWRGPAVAVISIYRFLSTKLSLNRLLVPFNNNVDMAGEKYIFKLTPTDPNGSSNVQTLLIPPLCSLEAKDVLTPGSRSHTPVPSRSSTPQPSSYAGSPRASLSAERTGLLTIRVIEGSNDPKRFGSVTLVNVMCLYIRPKSFPSSWRGHSYPGRTGAEVRPPTQTF